MGRKIRKLLAIFAVGCMTLGLVSLSVGAASAATPAAGCVGVTITLAQTPNVVTTGQMTVVATEKAIVIPTLVDQRTGVTLIAFGFGAPDTKVVAWSDLSIKPGDVLQAFLGPGNPCGDPLTVVGPAPTNSPPTVALVGTPTSAAQGGVGTASFDITNPNNNGISYEVMVNNSTIETLSVGAGQSVRLDVSRSAGDYALTLRAGGSVTNPVNFTIPSVVTPPPPVAAQPTVTLESQPAPVKEGESTSVDLLITNTADDTHASVVYSAGGKSITLADGESGVLSISLPSGTHQVSVTGDDGTSVSISVTVEVCEPTSTPTPTPTQTSSPTSTPTPTKSVTPTPTSTPTTTVAPTPTATHTAVVVPQGTTPPTQAAAANNQWQPDLAAHGDGFDAATQPQAGSFPWTTIGLLLVAMAGILTIAYVRLGRVARHA